MNNTLASLTHQRSSRKRERERRRKSFYQMKVSSVFFLPPVLRQTWKVDTPEKNLLFFFFFLRHQQQQGVKSRKSFFSFLSPLFLLFFLLLLWTNTWCVSAVDVCLSVTCLKITLQLLSGKSRKWRKKKKKSERICRLLSVEKKRCLSDFLWPIQKLYKAEREGGGKRNEHEAIKAFSFLQELSYKHLSQSLNTSKTE